MRSEPLFEVIDPGLLTTIQDAGRPGAAHLGVPRSGACDPDALAAANALVANTAGAAALEMTIVGPTLSVRHLCVVAVAGADLGGRVDPDGRRLIPGWSFLLRRGSTLSFPGRVPGTRGCRAYLAVPGGFDVPAVLGSRSTLVSAGLGGMEGRPLRGGDRLGAATRSEAALAGRHSTTPTDEPDGEDGPAVLRVVPGPRAAGADPDLLAALLDREWRVASESDRMGVRLDGEPLLVRGRGAALISLPMIWGAIQVPPDGSPRVLLPDHQTVGGYPVVAVVFAEDRGRLGQLAAGDAVTFALSNESPG